MNLDEYNEVLNGSQTYLTIAEMLRTTGMPVLVGWTDNAQHSHHDILFALRPSKFGNIGRGLALQNMLMVAVIGVGAFGFDYFDRSMPLYSSYVSEKLNMGENTTTEDLTQLINGVIEALNQ